MLFSIQTAVLGGSEEGRGLGPPDRQTVSVCVQQAGDRLGLGIIYTSTTGL